MAQRVSIPKATQDEPLSLRAGRGGLSFGLRAMLIAAVPIALFLPGGPAPTSAPSAFRIAEEVARLAPGGANTPGSSWHIWPGPRFKGVHRFV